MNSETDDDEDNPVQEANSRPVPNGDNVSGNDGDNESSDNGDNISTGDGDDESNMDSDDGNVIPEHADDLDFFRQLIEQIHGPDMEDDEEEGNESDDVEGTNFINFI